MKRILFGALIMTMLLSLTACSQEPSSTADSGQNSAVVTDEAIWFADPVLEKKVRAAMNKPEGDITIAQAQAVIQLDIGNESFEKMDDVITDISGLQYFTGLEELNISFNEVSDLSPLAGLTNLKTLVFNGTKVRDISPLKDLTNLQCLIFCWINENYGMPGGIDNLDALGNMKNLEMLDAKNTGINDVSGLSNLPKLWEVQLNQNQINDVSPFATLPNLKTLLLEDNPVTDYSPLKDVYNTLEGKDFKM